VPCVFQFSAASAVAFVLDNYSLLNKEMGGIVTKAKLSHNAVAPDIGVADNLVLAGPVADPQKVPLSGEVSVAGDAVTTSMNVNKFPAASATEFAGGNVPAATEAAVVSTDATPTELQDHVQHETGLVFRDQVPNSSNFLAAVKQGNFDTVKRLLQGGVDDIAASTGAALAACLGMWSSTPLIIACQYGHREIALLLLDHSSVAVAAHLNEKGASALLYACLDPSMALVVHGLVAKLASDPATADRAGSWVNAPPASIYHPKYDRTLSLSPLSAVVMSNNVDCSAAILNHFPFSPEAPVQFDTPFGKGMLTISGLASSSAAGTKPAPGKAVGAKGLTPVMLACAYGSVGVLEALLMHRTADGASSAALSGHFCTHRDELGCSVLHHLCKSTCSDEKTLIVALDHLLADITMVGASGAQLLRGLVNAADAEGNTALHYACDSKFSQLVLRLLSLQAEPSSGDVTALCNLDAQNVNGATALYVAIKKRCEPAVITLLQPPVEGGARVGADPLLADRNGVSSLALAKKLRADSRVYKEVVAAAAAREQSQSSTGAQTQATGTGAQTQATGTGAQTQATGSGAATASPLPPASSGDKEEEVSAPAAVDADGAGVAAVTFSVSSTSLLPKLEAGVLNIPAFQGPSAAASVPAAPVTKNTAFNRHGSRTRVGLGLGQQTSVDDCLPTLSRKNSSAAALPTLADVGLVPPLVKSATTDVDALVITDL
jgi:ankyrin repeat protein